MGSTENYSHNWMLDEHRAISSMFAERHTMLTIEYGRSILACAVSKGNLDRDYRDKLDSELCEKIKQMGGEPKTIIL